MKIKIETKPKTKPGPASAFKRGQLFIDSQGDLYVRCSEGAICVEEPDSLILYTECELGDFGYLENCSRAHGKITITIEG